MCFSSLVLLTACDRNNSNVPATAQRPSAPHSDSLNPTSVTPSVNFKPAVRNPMLSMQPLKPGLSWTYDVKVFDNPVIFRRFSGDLTHGTEYMAMENTGPMNESAGIGSRLRYTVTDRTKQLDTDYGPSTFYMIKTESFNNGKWSEVDNGLFWGRVRMGTMSFAICETREFAQASRNMDPAFKMIILRNLSDVFKTTERSAFHTRFLTGDICLHQDAPGIVDEDEFSIGGIHVGIKERWDFKTTEGWLKTTVPAGTFETIRTTFNFSGASDMDTTDELLYSMNVGLVKWVQSSGGKTNWTAELTNYNFSK